MLSVDTGRGIDDRGVEQMTTGRMHRETNPIPGEKPGFTPQYKNTDGSFIEVTPDTPYPVTDTDVYVELQQVKAELQALKERLEEPLFTQLTGRNVEVITVFEGLAITNTNINLSKKLDVTKYKKISFLVRNTLDSDITLHLFDQTKSPWQVLIEEKTPEGWKQTPGVSINSNSQKTRTLPLSMFFSTNIDVIFEAIRIGATAKNTPTTGSLTIYLLGVVN